MHDIKGPSKVLTLVSRAMFLLTMSTAFFLSKAFAEGPIDIDPQTGSRIIRNVIPPKIVYHWTTLKSLAKVAGEKAFSEGWDKFNKRGEGEKKTGFFSWWPQFEETYGGLFTWIHPILGMKGGEFEEYGNILVQIEIDTQIVRAARVEAGYMHSDGRPRYQSPIDVSDIDMVDNGNEWVIVNPRSIKNFTADVNVLRPLLEKELSLLKDPSHRYEATNIHFMDYKGGGYRDTDYLLHAISVVEHLLQTNPDAIPSWFRRDNDGKPVFDKWITGPEALNTTIPAEIKRSRRAVEFESKRVKLEAAKEALAKIDPTAPCGVFCLLGELESRVNVYVDEHPTADHLISILNKLQEVFARAEGLRSPRIWYNFEDKQRRIAQHMRHVPFDPYQSIVDMTELVESDNYNFLDLAKLLKAAPDLEEFKDAYNATSRPYNESLRFLIRYSFQQAERLKHLQCIRALQGA